MQCASPKLAEETRRLLEALLDKVPDEATRVGRPEIQNRAAVARVILGALVGLALQSLQGAGPEELHASYEALEHILKEMLM